MNTPNRILDYLWRLVASGVAFLVGAAVAAAILTPTGLHSMALPVGATTGKSELFSIALCPFLALGLAPLAAGLSGRYRVRWFAIAFLAFINMGVNTAIESKIFTSMFAQGGAAYMILMFAGAATVFALVLVGLFHRDAALPTLTVRRSPLGWVWRIVLAILAFPVVYFVFGSAVAPFVLATYRAGVAGLILPPLSVILPVQLVRSALFLLASLPAILLWARSRWGLVLALGWAHAVTVGLYGLLGAYWFPTILRVAHSIEITFDSFVYALIIVMLLKPRAVPADGPAETATPVRSATGV